ncbi:MAG: HAD family hydrolase [Oleiphilaceae bacterium]|nr:HAD family hydrolase [Oleiphilaceae bacterium]
MEKAGTSRPLQYAGVIFDLDGTLVSSQLDFATMRRELQCPANQDLLVYIEALPEQQQRQAMAVVHRHETEDAARSQALPGVARQLAYLDSLGLPTAIVTRNSRSATTRKLNAAGLQFELVLTREDAPPKPDPSALLAVAEQWSLPPQQCIYLGDFRYDLEAALAADMHAWLYAPHALPDYAILAHRVLRHFDELGQALFDTWARDD